MAVATNNAMIHPRCVRTLAVPQLLIFQSELSTDKNSVISGNFLHTAPFHVQDITLLNYWPDLQPPLSHTPVARTPLPIPATAPLPGRLGRSPAAYFSVRAVNGQKFGNVWAFPPHRPSRHLFFSCCHHRHTHLPRNLCRVCHC